MAKEKQKQEFEEKQPVFRKKIRASKDGSWLIIETIRTDFVHANYLQAILQKGGSDKENPKGGFSNLKPLRRIQDDAGLA